MVDHPQRPAPFSRKVKSVAIGVTLAVFAQAPDQPVTDYFLLVFYLFFNNITDFHACYLTIAALRLNRE